LLASIAVVAVLGACGGDSAPMNGEAAKQLRDRVTAVRTALEARDVDGAGRALDALRQTVAQLRRDDGLSDSRAADILAAANGVDDQLVTITTTTTTTTTTVPPPPTKPGKAPKPEGPGGKGKD
jgi:cell division protein FtsN